MINSSMSKFTAEDSATKLLFFLYFRNNFFVFFGMISNKRLKMPTKYQAKRTNKIRQKNVEMKPVDQSLFSYKPKKNKK